MTREELLIVIFPPLQYPLKYIIMRDCSKMQIAVIRTKKEDEL